MAGGKRLRPVLTLAAAEAAGRVTREPNAEDLAIPAACAVEFIHTYSLIHDDLPAMDDDALRRGLPTLHVLYGDGLAILAGDALQAEAFAVVAREPASHDARVDARKLAVVARIADAAGARGMVGGQIIDLQAAGRVNGPTIRLDADGLRAMHRSKTGALITASAAAGAIMAGAEGPLVEAVERWAEEIGLAFQIVDDILDVEGDAAELGKTAGKDARSAKPTYPSLFGLSQSRAMAAECRERARALLRDAQLSDSWLDAIADWVVARKS
jgi:geranylgeranyl pyrophosphate synthase